MESIFLKDVLLAIATSVMSIFGVWIVQRKQRQYQLSLDLVAIQRTLCVCFISEVHSFVLRARTVGNLALLDQRAVDDKFNELNILMPMNITEAAERLRACAFAENGAPTAKQNQEYLYARDLFIARSKKRS